MVIPREVKKGIKVKSWSKEIRSLQETLTLNLLQKQVLIGAMLGDGCLAPNVYGKNFRLEMIQSDKQKPYLDWKAEIFHAWCLSKPHFHDKTRSWRLKTVSHPELTAYHSLFYIDGKKVVPQSIGKLLNSAISLAVWFMDDGTKGPANGYTFNTQNFSREESETLVRVLKRNFGLEYVSIHRDKKYFRIYLKTNSVSHFENLIRPYLIPSMLYKLHS